MEDLFAFASFVSLFLVVILVISVSTNQLTWFFFRRRWRKVLEHGLTYEEPRWWEVLISEQRGKVYGHYKGTPIEMELYPSSLAIKAEGEGQLPDDLMLQKKEPVRSLLPSFLTDEEGTHKTGDRSFDRQFTTRGDPILADVMLTAQVRKALHTFVRHKHNTDEQLSLWLREGCLEINMRDNTYRSFVPEKILDATHRLYEALLLPKDEEQRALAMATRLVGAFEESAALSRRIKLATIHLTVFPTCLAQSGLLAHLAAAKEPILRYMALEYKVESNGDITPLLAVASDEGESKALRLKTFDLLDEKAPPESLYSLYTSCMSSKKMAIRREAKKRRKKLAINNTAFGQLSLHTPQEEAGQLSLSQDHGQLSLTNTQDTSPSPNKEEAET